MRVGYLLTVVASLMAGNALADARFSASTPSPTPAPIWQFAQVSIDTLPASDLRRLDFYTQRAIDALDKVVESASERDILEQSNVNMQFRMSISRLVDAGERSGLTVDQTAEYYVQAVTEVFGLGFMQKVAEVAGGLDIYTLFRNVSIIHDPRASPMDDGMSFLNALAIAGEGLSLSAKQDEEETAEEAEVMDQAEEVVVAAPALPVALPNANALERAVIERVVLNGDRWEITVIQGDSLAMYASALYGNSLAYDIIFRANTNVMSNPNSLRVGLTLQLPKP